MKVLFWTDGFWPRLGGIETQGFQFVKEMQKRNHEYVVWAQKDRVSWKEEETHEGIFIQRFDFNAIIAKGELGWIRLVQEQLEQILEKFQPDLIHLNSCLGGCAFVFSLFMKMFRVPIVLTAHAPNFYEGNLPSVIEKIIFSVDRIGCVSNWVLQSLETHIPSIKNKLRLIYNGLPMPDVCLSPLNFSSPILLVFGRLSWEKGFSTAIEAFSLFKKKGLEAQLIVAGGGDARPSLEKLVDALELRDSVLFTGVLTNEEVLSWFNRSTLVLVPSILESFGLVILEAMQMGRPVIASRVEGVPEVVSDQQTGLLVPCQDPMALCEAIESLLNAPERAMGMGREGRKRAREKFTIDQNAMQYEDLYKELILESVCKAGMR